MFKKKRLAILFLFAALFFSAEAGASENTPIGIWVTVFSPEKVLYSRENADRMIDTCSKTGISRIYLQVYRANKAYYDSDIADTDPFDAIRAASGCDTVKYIIEKAKKNGIEIHAWMNLLSLAENEKAEILEKYGEGILTLDNNGHPSFMPDDPSYGFILEKQIFLEPGDWRVKEYLANIADEIVRKYPGLAGIHLDYIRYPVAVPFAPGARFDDPAISYGYSDINIKKCKKLTGLDIKKDPHTRENCQKWDDWRRQQVTGLLETISKNTRSEAPHMQISCAVSPSVERAYLISFQDWTKWLSEGLADYVVTMNYTDDDDLFILNTRTALLPDIKEKVHIGTGAYLLKDQPEKLENQLRVLYGLHPGGIVIFSYDEIAESKGLREFLKNKDYI